MRLLLVNLFCLIYFNTLAQEILLEKDVSKRNANNKSGILHKHFYYFTADYSFFFIGNKDFPCIPFKSHAFTLGLKYQHRITGNFMAGFTGSYYYNSYHIDQTENKNFPTAEIFDKEKIQLHKVYFDLYSRVLLKKIYNHLGVYIDAGLYFTYLLNSRHIIIASDTVYNGAKSILKIKGLKYIEPYNYGITCRIGYKYLAMAGRYSLHNQIKNDYYSKQLPAFTLGLEINIY